MVKRCFGQIFWMWVFSSVCGQVGDIYGQAEVKGWTDEMEWQSFQNQMFKNAEIKKTTSEGQRPFDDEFLKRLRQGKDEEVFLRLGFLSSLWTSSLSGEEISALWQNDVPQMRRRLLSYLTGKFIGTQLVQYYLTLEKTLKPMPAHLFDLTLERFKKLTALGFGNSIGYVQQAVMGILDSKEMFQALKRYLTEEGTRRQARAFEVALAAQFVPLWVHQYITAPERTCKAQLEKMLLCVPSKALLMAARLNSLDVRSAPEAVASYALVASKNKKARRECDAFVAGLINKKNVKAFEPLLLPKAFHLKQAASPKRGSTVTVCNRIPNRTAKARP